MTMSETSRIVVAPRANPETQAFWNACNDRKLLLKRCRSCGQTHHYPRAFCPHCFSGDTEFVESAGNGEIHSFTVMRRAPVAYVLAFVTLDEGVTILTNIVNCDPDALQIGGRVGLDFETAPNGQFLPVFVPA